MMTYAQSTENKNKYQIIMHKRKRKKKCKHEEAKRKKNSIEEETKYKKVARIIIEVIFVCAPF